jgi:hypothetical protein
MKTIDFSNEFRRFTRFCNGKCPATRCKDRTRQTDRAHCFARFLDRYKHRQLIDVSELAEIIKDGVQATGGSSPCNAYFAGMINGMEWVRTVITGTEQQFVLCPTRWERIKRWWKMRKVRPLAVEEEKESKDATTSI